VAAIIERIDLGGASNLMRVRVGLTVPSKVKKASEQTDVFNPKTEIKS
jgi:hypothetical protein